MALETVEKVLECEKAAAEKLSNARKKAEQILEDAEKEAAKIVALAEQTAALSEEENNALAKEKREIYAGLLDDAQKQIEEIKNKAAQAEDKAVEMTMQKILRI